MPHAAQTLDTARKNCSPKPLLGAGITDFWVETADARDSLTSFRDSLKSVLDEDTPHKVLVHGHRGCGKSTEINKFLATLDSHWLPVSLNAGDYLPTSGNEAADVLLAACTKIMEVAEREELSLNDKSMEGVWKFFDQTTETKTGTRDATVKAEGGVKVSESFLGKLFGLKADLVSALKFGSRTEESTVHQIRRRKGELCAAVNALGNAAEIAWREKSNNPNARILLVIEELDKLGLADARQIFVHDGRILSEVAIRAIYTIPVFTFHSADAGAIRSHFEHDFALPMIKVFDRTCQPCTEGRSVLTAIVRKRVLPSVLPDDALAVLIEKTGGVLRDIFDAIQTAAQFNTVRKTGIIDSVSIGQALDRMVNLIGLQIAYPPEEKKEPAPLQIKLAAIAKAQAAGKTTSAQPDPDIQLLLMSGALLEYNGQGWLGVHPLARQYLKALGYDVG